MEGLEHSYVLRQSVFCSVVKVFFLNCFWNCVTAISRGLQKKID